MPISPCISALQLRIHSKPLRGFAPGVFLKGGWSHQTFSGNRLHSHPCLLGEGVFCPVLPYSCQYKPQGAEMMRVEGREVSSAVIACVMNHHG
jgi:hypothetical protein